MAFTSTLFLILFLPGAVSAHYFAQARWRNIIVLFTSGFFYFWFGLDFLCIIFAASLAGWILGLCLDRCKNGALRKIILLFSVLVFVGLLFYYKYLPGFAKFFFKRDITAKAQPLGASFYVFSLLSYIFDVYWQKSRAQKNFAKVLSYVMFFPKVVQGPIARWNEFSDQLESRQVTIAGIDRGLCRFAVGMFKKVMIADTLAVIVSYSFENIAGAGTVPAWLGIAAYLLQLYYDFSGYSDMAVGLGWMFGFNLPENFDHPYLSFGVSEFWRRWHISLGAWFRDYVYTPVYRAVSKKSSIRKIAGGIFVDLSSLLVVWILTGLWHGNGGGNVKFLVYGLWWFVFIMAERIVEYFQKKYRRKKGIKKAKMTAVEKIIRCIETIGAVTIGQVIFRAGTLQSAKDYLKTMFCYSAPDGCLFLKDYSNDILFALLLGAAFSFPLHRFLREKVFEKNTGSKVAYRVIVFMLFFISFITSVNKGFSPFLYEIF